VEVVSILIHKELQEEVSKLNLDWEDYLRRAIEEKVRAEMMR